MRNGYWQRNIHLLFGEQGNYLRRVGGIEFVSYMVGIGASSGGNKYQFSGIYRRGPLEKARAAK